jgi:D-glycero-alpha-D-manno-heptose 1-phosphate guanylyltransferase
METVILAGGFGTRLKSVVPDLPKPMARVCGRPFLEIVMDRLAANGTTHAVLALGFKADIIQQHFGARYAGIELSYSVESVPLGTGGATRLALEQCRSDHAFVCNGDTFLDLDIGKVETLWQSKRKNIVIARHVNDAGRYGRLLVRGGLVTEFCEKGSNDAGLINAGCYVLARTALDRFNAGQPFSLERDFLVPASAERSLHVLVTDGCFIDIGIPEDFLMAQTELAPWASRLHSSSLQDGKD